MSFWQILNRTGRKNVLETDVVKFHILIKLSLIACIEYVKLVIIRGV